MFTHKQTVSLILGVVTLCSSLFVWTGDTSYAAPAENGAGGAVFFVAPDGGDADSGSESAPLASLAGARDKIRALKESSGLPDGGVTVYVRGGTYPVTETVFFDEGDSGTEGSPIRYAAYPGETPVFNGGSYIDGSDFARIADKAALARLSPKARDKVLCYNL
ncbi:MAG: hypothetical protein LBL26_08210, partial [Peptococcaceae bacterium]|nr:hypothetical protein [Peptococcaceae bacterium]